MAPMVAPSSPGGPPVIPPVNSGMTARRHDKGWLIAVGVAVGLMCTALIVWAVLHALHSFANGLDQGFDLSGLTQDGAAKASLADGVAKAHHIPDGALTLALLNTLDPDATWLPGGDSVPMNGRTVSITAAGNHVVTAVNFGICEYGLTVAATNDPIIGEYDLPGAGTYFAYTDLPGSTRTCSADTAPSSGWVRADNSVVTTLNGPPSG